MAKQKTKEEIQVHCKSALAAIEKLLNGYIDSENPSVQSKADKLSYWLEDYSEFLTKEPTFSPRKMKKYKRGEIVKVHLGYNIGSEEGGLHYCVILDKDNSPHHPTVTIIPLTSVKPNTNTDNLYPGDVYLGNSVYTAMSAKFTSLSKSILQDFEKTNEQYLKLTEIAKTCKEDDEETTKYFEEEEDRLKKELKHLSDQTKLLGKVKQESQKMKKGSVALVSQITTISKLRIYDPKTSHDVLADIRLSNENLDLIDAEIKKIFLK